MILNFSSSGAPYRLPLNCISISLCRGIAFFTKAFMPYRSGIPTFTSGKQKKPLSARMKRKSQAQDMIAPLPKAWPLMAAMVGMGMSISFLNTSFILYMKSLIGWNSFFMKRGPIHATSTPWEKFFSSLEVRIRACTDVSATISSMALFIAMAKSRFCLFSPLFMVIIATFSSFDQDTIDMGVLLLNDGYIVPIAACDCGPHRFEPNITMLCLSVKN